jgi:hypothetical protein
MSDAFWTGLVSAACSGVVIGAIEGWRRAGLKGALQNLQTQAEEHARGLAGGVEARAREAAAAATARAQSLGSNLGPRVQDMAERLARLEGALGVEPKRTDPGKMETAADARPGR